MQQTLNPGVNDKKLNIYNRFNRQIPIESAGFYRTVYFKSFIS